MLKFVSENTNCLTPSNISDAFSASGISHRFVLVLECETRLNTKNQIELPQFVIGGPKGISLFSFCLFVNCIPFYRIM